MLETRFGGLSVCVENDVHCAALAALRYGVGRSLTHFVYVHVGHGIAAGIIIGGEVYTGATGNAGEFGHIPVEKDGPICYCGSRGCLESVAGAPAIVDSVRSALAKGVHSSLVGGEVTLANILLAADGGDRLAATVLERAAGYIGDAVGGLVNLLNPQAVVLGGLLAMPGGVFLSTLEKSLLSRVMPLLQDSVVIRASELGSDAAALGAAGLVFERMFDNPSILLTRLASGASSPS
jgi:glucokinase